MVAYKRVIAPTGVVVDIEEAKARLRVDFTDDDDLIESFIRAATAHLEGPRGFLGRALLEQTWDLFLDRFPGDPYLPFDRRIHWRHPTCDLAIEIGLPPLIDVDGVFYLDSDGGEHEIDADAYVVDSASEPARVAPVSSWPTAATRINAVRVRFRAGYLDQTVSPAEAAVPDDIKTGLLLLVGELYKRRETSVDAVTVTSVPWSAEQILKPYRVHKGFA